MRRKLPQLTVVPITTTHRITIVIPRGVVGPFIAGISPERRF